MTGAIILALILWCVVGGGVGAAIGNSKGRGVEGLWLGFFLGWIGWIIVAVMQPTPEAEAQHNALVQSADSKQMRLRGDARTCPWCAETIKSAAVICRFCNRDVSPLPTPENSPAPHSDTFACPN